MATLEHVALFHNRGGDFAIRTQKSLDPDTLPLGLTAAQRADLVGFSRYSRDSPTRTANAPFANFLQPLKK